MAFALPHASAHPLDPCPKLSQIPLTPLEPTKGGPSGNMLPDGPPLVGSSGVKGIWLNLGHGSSGWALACGSAKAIADMVSQHKTEIDMQGFDYQRLK